MTKRTIIEVSRPGSDAIGAPADYATMQSDVAGLTVATELSGANLQVLNDYTNVVGDEAAGDGTTDDTAAIQAKLDAGTVVALRPDRVYQVETLVLNPGNALEGLLSERGGSGAILGGTVGMNVIELGSTEGPSGMAVRNIQIYNGLNGITSEWGAAWVQIENVVTAQQSNAGIYCTQAIERWTVRRCWLTQAKHGFQMENLNPNFPQNNVIDKNLFDCVSATGNEYGWHLDIGYTGNSNTWLNCINSTQGKHGMYLAGALNESVFINMNNEAVGYDAPYDLVQTTGTIAASSASLVVASATGWHDGDDINIHGAGVNGSDLQTTIVSRAGTTFTLADAASRARTAAKVTNAIYDDVHMAYNGVGQPTRNTFVGGGFGSNASGARLRYGVLSTGANRFIGSAFAEPCYSPDGSDSFIDCLGNIRIPPTLDGWHPYPGNIQMTQGEPYEGERSMIVSGRNKPLQFWLADSVGNGSGTRDWLEVRLQDGNHTLAFAIDGDTGDIYQNLNTGKMVMVGALDHDGSTAGFYGTTPVAKQTGVAVTAAGVHAALVALGLISA